MTKPTDTLIIGIGNRYRGDDALGCLMADELAGCAEGVEAIEHSGEPASLIDLWQDKECVILIDAVSSEAETGTLHRIDLTQNALPDRFRSYSSHAFGIAEAVELSRVLGKLPSKMVFYGIEGGNFSGGADLSLPLQQAAQELKRRVLDEITTDVIPAQAGIHSSV